MTSPDKSGKGLGPVDPKPPAADVDKSVELEQRIERLEKRLDETVGDARAPETLRQGLDEPDDPLRRAVERSNSRRAGDK